MKSSIALLAALSALAFAGQAAAGAAEDVIAKEKCGKCHTATTTKKAPSWASVAEKYKGKADAKEKLLFNVTKEPLVKLEDGTEQKHKLIDTTNKKELDNLFEFILSRQ